MGKKIISFDMDGTLITPAFADGVWLEGIPYFYAKKHGGEIDAAQKHILGEYATVGREAIEWYDIHYWLKRFSLDIDWKTLLSMYRGKVEMFPEVPEILSALGDHYTLIIVSNAAQEFLGMELEISGLGHHFRHVFSAVTDFGKTKKDTEVYHQICKVLGITVGDMIHVGDDWQFDYLTPQKAGIEAFYLNRHTYHSSPKQHHIIPNLKTLATHVLA